MRKSAKSLIFNLFGGVFLILGVAGIFLPLLPATPFLLLTAYCFSKGSPRFHHWLLDHKYLGQPIKDWERKGVIRAPAKILTVTMLSLSGVFLYLKEDIHLVVKIVFIGVAATIAFFVWSRPEK